MVKKIKVKVGNHRLSPNNGRHIIFGYPVIDGIQEPHHSYKTAVRVEGFTFTPIIEGPYYKSVWKRLKELFK